MGAEFESIKAENMKVKSDLKLRESDMRIYHSKYHKCRAEMEVLRHELKKAKEDLLQQKDLNQSSIASSSSNELDEIIQYLAIEANPDQNSGSQNKSTVENEQPVNGQLSTPNNDHDFWKDFLPPRQDLKNHYMRNPLYEEPVPEPLVVEMSSDSDENGNHLSQFDQYQTGNSKDNENPLNLTITPRKPTKRRIFEDIEGNTAKKSVRSVFASSSTTS